MFSACAPGDLFAQIFRHKIKMLDKPAVEIHHVERAVRTSGEVYWMKPRIGRGKKFLSDFTTQRSERHTVRRQHPTMHQIAQRFADKGITAIFFAQAIAAINCQARKRVKMT